MIISEWTLNEKILLEWFRNHCISNGIVAGSENEWQLLFSEWKELYKEWLRECGINVDEIEDKIELAKKIESELKF